ncbi:MAG TPA: hypothetical protein V6D15_00005 [Oculatellaceae cyanobacterium]|jgi:DNA polymerase-3 subunit delta'
MSILQSLPNLPTSDKHSREETSWTSTSELTSGISPGIFDTIVGQDLAVNLLTSAITSNHLPTAYLFAGQNGVGKRLTTICLIQALFPANSLAQIQAGTHPDLLWITPTYQHQDKLFNETEAIAYGIKRKVPPVIRIDQVREITQFTANKPLLSNRKIVVIENAETLHPSAANALLKTLESPNSTLMILLTSSPEKLLPTIVSRCQIIPLTG